MRTWVGKQKYIMDNLLNKKIRITEELNNDYGASTSTPNKRVSRRPRFIRTEDDQVMVGFKPEVAHARDIWMREHNQTLKYAQQAVKEDIGEIK